MSSSFASARPKGGNSEGNFSGWQITVLCLFSILAYGRYRLHVPAADIREPPLASDSGSNTEEEPQQKEPQ